MTDRDEWERRRRLAEVFGDDLPGVTTDEASPTSDRDHSSARSADDRWFLDNRPPHHG
ncbi:hypothetical protein [Williamsia herbipolensis]|uniref:hypothetical protein n=1 Tax=Williamsia herbipolensis TaxID=1603258 RepID=UPI000A429179|nr:hypothetical protein [Williamsia herbipolensis]